VLADMEHLISKILAIVFAALCAVFVAVWVRSYWTADMYDIRLSNEHGIEFGINWGYFTAQSTSGSFVFVQLLRHDSMGAQPLLGIVTWSFAGFSVRTFQWRFMTQKPATIYVVPDWFICLVPGIFAIGFAVLCRRRKPVFEVIQKGK
jgi:hypothetical protein